MSQFHGRRNNSGEWEWEGEATLRLRVFSVPLLIGAILAFVALGLVFASNGWSFTPVSPNSCTSAAPQNATSTPAATCAPCPSTNSVSAQNQDCHTCSPRAASADSAQPQWFDLPTCTPAPAPTGTPEPLCQPAANDPSAAQPQWWDLPTCTPAPTPTPSPSPTARPTDTPSPTPACSNAGYDASLTSPTPPNASKDYTYTISGCNTPQIKFVKLSGCWSKNDVASVETNPGGKTIEILDDGTVKVSDLSDADLPLTITIHFKSTHTSADDHTNIWLWVGPGDSDGFTVNTGGPLCEPTTSTATPPVTGTPVVTPSPSPTPPTDTPAPPTNIPTPSTVPTTTPTNTPAPTPTSAPATQAPSPVPTCEADASGQCHTCSPRADGADSAQPQWFDLPTCTPAPAPPPDTDIALVKTDAPDPVQRGATLVYTITVNDVSSVDAQNVVVTDTPPDAVNFVSATPSQGSCTGMVCRLGTLAAGKAAVIQVVVTVKANAPDAFTNMACAATSTRDKNMDNNCDTEDTHVPGVTPTALLKTATPRAMPNTGGTPGDGGSSWMLILSVGIGTLVTGAVVVGLARRRARASTMEW